MELDHIIDSPTCVVVLCRRGSAERVLAVFLHSLPPSLPVFLLFSPFFLLATNNNNNKNNTHRDPRSRSPPRARWKWRAWAATPTSALSLQLSPSCNTSLRERGSLTARAPVACIARPLRTPSPRASDGGTTGDPFPPCPRKTGWGRFWAQSAGTKRRMKTSSGSGVRSRSSTRSVCNWLLFSGPFVAGTQWTF